MRSKDYKDQKLSFTPLQPRQMVRVALVNGMNPDVEPDLEQRRKYCGLVGRFNDISDSLLARITNIFETGSLSSRRRGDVPAKIALKRYLEFLHYDAEGWKPLDYRELKRAGVVVDFDVDASGLDTLVRTVVGLPRHKVIELSRPIEREGVDYLKHVDWRQKLVLNGREVVVAFADEHDITVPGSYREKGVAPPVSMYRDLAAAGFTFRAAMETAGRVIKTDGYRDRDISVMVIRHRNGDELRMHHHDNEESAEFSMYAKEFGLRVTETLGDRLDPHGEEKYVLNVYDTPSRSRRGLSHAVELSYLPDFRDPTRKTLQWMNYVALCPCEWARNLRNFVFGSGETKHTAFTHETHSGVAVLAIQVAQDLSPLENPQNLSPIPTPELAEFIDVMRYQVMQGHKATDYVNEPGIEIMINEFWKQGRRMYWPAEKVGDRLLGRFYL